MQTVQWQCNCVSLQIMLKLNSVIMFRLDSEDCHILRCSLLISVKFSFHKRSRTTVGLPFFTAVMCTIHSYKIEYILAESNYTEVSV